MSVAAEAPTEEVFAGDGTASPLPISYYFLDGNDLVVTPIVAGIESDVPLVRGVDYTVTGGGTGGGTVIPAAARAVGTSWRVRRETPTGQSSIMPTSSYNGEQLEIGLDRQGLINQEQDREIDRSLRVPRGESGLPVASLADANGMVLAIVDDVITPIENDPAAVAENLAQTIIERNLAETAADAADDDAAAAGVAANAALGAQGAALDAQAQSEAARDAAFGYGAMVPYRTWALLNAVTGAAGNMAVVPIATGTHTDPVVGGTVNNQGTYAWSTSPAGWERIGDAAAAIAALAQAAAEASGEAFSQVTERRNMFVDPYFQQSSVLAKQTSGLGSSGVWTGITAQAIGESADGETSLIVTNGTVTAQTPAERLGVAGDSFTFGVKINQRSYNGAGTLQIYVDQLNSAGSVIAGSVKFLKSPVTSSSTTPETAWVTDTIKAGAVGIRFSVQASGHASNMFEVSKIDLHRGSRQAHRPNINRIGFPVVYFATTGSDSGRGTSSDPFLTPSRALAEIKRANDRVMVGRVLGYGGDYVTPSLLMGDANGGAQPFAGHVELMGLDQQRVRLISSGAVLLSSITKTAGRTNVYQAALTTNPPATSTDFYPPIFEHDTLYDLIGAAERRPLHRGRTHRSPVGIMQKVASLALCDATPGSWYWASNVIYFHTPTSGDPTTNGKSYYVPKARTGAGAIDLTMNGIQYGIPAFGDRRAGSVLLSGLDFYYWNNSVNLLGIAYGEVNDCRSIGSGGTGFEFGSSSGVARRCEAIGAGLDGFGWTVGVAMPVGDTFRAGRWTVEDPYAALCQDDAISMHAMCDTIVRGGLLERVGDAGIAPAIGGTCVVEGTRVYEAGSSWYIGAAGRTGEGIGLRQGSTTVTDGDQRSGTMATVRNAEIENCLYGLRSGAFTGNRLDARNVLTIGCGTHYFKDTLSDLVLTDCRYRGSGVVTTGSPTVLTSSAVV